MATAIRLRHIASLSPSPTSTHKYLQPTHNRKSLTKPNQTKLVFPAVNGHSRSWSFSQSQIQIQT